MGHAVPNTNTVSAVARLPGRLDLFVTGNPDDEDHAGIYTARSNPDGSWSGINHDWFRIGRDVHTVPVGNTVAAVAPRPNQIDLFVVGNDGGIYTARSNPAGNWGGVNHNWSRIGRDVHNVPMGNTVTAIAPGPNQIDLFVTGNPDDDDHAGIFTARSNPDGSWGGLNHNWFQIGHPVVHTVPVGNTVGAVARSPNQIDLFVVGNDGGIYTARSNPDGSWGGVNHNWSRIGRDVHNVPLSNTVTAIAPGPNQIDLFVTGNPDDDDHAGIFTARSNPDGSWGGLNHNWFQIGDPVVHTVPVGNTVAAVAPRPNQIDLFVVGNDGGIFTTRSNPDGNWGGASHNWFRIGRGDQNVPEGNTVTAVPRQPSEAGGAVDFTDWLEVDADRNLAKGTLHGAPVSLSGSDVGASSVTDQTFPWFAGPFFSPAVSMSDVLEIRGLPGFSYVLTFGSPVRDPILHLASLASRVDFPPGTVLSKVSGQETFQVVDSSVMGAVLSVGPPNDANGTVRLIGDFDSLSFSVTPLFDAAQGDGIWFQVGAAAAALAPPPAAPATDLLVVGHNGGIYHTSEQEGQPWASWARIGYKEFLVVHLKSLLQIDPPTAMTTFINTGFNRLAQLLSQFEIRVFRGTTEDLSGNSALAHLVNVDVGECNNGTTDEQDELFANRNRVGAGDLVVYFVQSTTPPFGGCATHPDGRPGAIVVQAATSVAPGASQWTLAHEVGHVLGLDHVDNTDRLMTPGNITNPPPDISADEVDTMLESDWTRGCSPDPSGW